jgi:cytidylate kinase
LGYLYLDTGALYRAVTWVALERGIPIEDQKAIGSLSEGLEIDIIHPEIDDGRQYTVLADGEDVTWQIRRPQVDAAVSPVSAYPGVREALLEQQRRVARKRQVVAVGRDIGTVVLPDAELKIYLDASPEERARRRHKQLAQQGRPQDYEELLEAMRRRDDFDSRRSVAPLRPASDAIVMDTDNMGIEKVLDRVLLLVDSALASEGESRESARGGMEI